MGLTLLALDTSTEACSVALLREGSVLSRHSISQHDHTKRILPMIDAVLAESECVLSEVDGIAFSRGPGSFTGIRIGIGIAQGLALGADKPLIAVSTLEILAQGAYRVSGATDVIAAIDARMNEVYIAQYHYKRLGQWNLIGKEDVVVPALVHEKITTNHNQTLFSAGTGFEMYPDLIPNICSSGIVLPEAQDMIPLAELAWHYHRLLQPDEVEPIYLRNQITWKKLPGRE